MIVQTIERIYWASNEKRNNLRPSGNRSLSLYIMIIKKVTNSGLRGFQKNYNYIKRIIIVTEVSN